MLDRHDPKALQTDLPLLEAYRHRFSLSRLRHGIDNVRYDVQISPALTKAARQITIQLISKMSGALQLPGFNPRFNWQQEENRFRQLCRAVLEDAVNRGKIENEPQVLYLALAAITTIFKQTVDDRYNSCLQHVKHLIWRSEVNYNHEAAVQLQEDLLNLSRNRGRIFRRVNQRLFQYLSATLRKGVNALYTIHFDESDVLPDAFFDNPLLHEEDPSQDELMIREYLLIGHRREDVHHYEAFLAVIRDVFRRLTADSERPGNNDPAAEPPEGEPALETESASIDAELDGLVKCEANIDALFDFRDTARQIRKQRRHWYERKDAAGLRKSAQAQEQRLAVLQKEFQRRGLLPIVLAVPEIKPLCRVFSPPLTPHEILQYLVDGGSRRRIRGKLKRLKKSYGETVDLSPFREAIFRRRRLSRSAKQEHLIAFVKRFCRYHKDLSDFKRILEAQTLLNFLSEDKDLELSSANGSLYSFMLPSEHSEDDSPVIGHVVLKADVRGSTGIVSEMKNKGLNPATNFSMNFFDPISEILARYGAQKIFIEGDAIILSIFEKENRSEQWYSVARSCGMAMSILLIVHRYNRKNQQSQLPHLEVGIGISHTGSAPTFFFDEDNRIMISPAVNQADRLSSCFKPLRQRFSTLKPPFNVYVFSPTPEDRSLVPEPFVRYNVGGIELNGEGFEKLKREIQLKPMEIELPGLQKEPVQIYSGNFPTVTGGHQSLIIREAQIPVISLKDMRVQGMSDSCYYEVCTHPLIYKMVREKTS